MTERRFLSMPDRVPNGEPINDAIAAMHAEQRKARELADKLPNPEIGTGASDDA